MSWGGLAERTFSLLTIQNAFDTISMKKVLPVRQRLALVFGSKKQPHSLVRGGCFFDVYFFFLVACIIPITVTMMLIIVTKVFTMPRSISIISFAFH